jgi:putative phosphoesterase
LAEVPDQAKGQSKSYAGFMRVGLLSDTHGFLDEALIGHFKECDEIWHAGDFGTAEVLDQLLSVKPVRGVFGNIDGPEVRARLPEDLEWRIEDVSVFMTHVGGYPGRYNPRARRELQRRKPGLFICGHSHIPRVMRDPELSLLHINPGASGHSGWHNDRTAMRFEIHAGKVANLVLIALGTRGRKAGPLTGYMPA